MSETVHHWKRSYQCAHTARDVSSAVLEAVKCAGTTATEKDERQMSAMLHEHGVVKYQGLFYRLVKKRGC